jgi:hypothetical protein
LEKEFGKKIKLFEKIFKYEHPIENCSRLKIDTRISSIEDEMRQ